jgi:hypothetical protein
VEPPPEGADEEEEEDAEEEEDPFPPRLFAEASVTTPVRSITVANTAIGNLVITLLIKPSYHMPVAVFDGDFRQSAGDNM